MDQFVLHVNKKELVLNDLGYFCLISSGATVGASIILPW
jgi:hypothetical protein